MEQSELLTVLQRLAITEHLRHRDDDGRFWHAMNGAPFDFVSVNVIF